MTGCYELIIEDVAMTAMCEVIKKDLDTFKITEIWIPDNSVGGDCFDMIKKYAPQFLQLIEDSAYEKFLEENVNTKFE